MFAPPQAIFTSCTSSDAIFNQYIFKRTQDQSGKFTILSNIFSKNKETNWLRALLSYITCDSLKSPVSVRKGRTKNSFSYTLCESFQ